MVGIKLEIKIFFYLCKMSIPVDQAVKKTKCMVAYSPSNFLISGLQYLGNTLILCRGNNNVSLTNCISDSEICLEEGDNCAAYCTQLEVFKI
jgi:hypothetical protein